MFRYSETENLKWIDYMPKFWYLSWDKVEFYSENDMENLSEEMQKIFREIEAYPTVIVNWVDYTRKVKSDESSSKCYSCEASF